MSIQAVSAHELYLTKKIAGLERMKELLDKENETLREYKEERDILRKAIQEYLRGECDSDHFEQALGKLK